MDESSQGELLELVRGARSDVEAEVGDYRRLIDQLGELEEALREGRAPPDLVRATGDMIVQFPGLIRPGTRAASRSDVPGERGSDLVQLRNKLKELDAGRG